MKAQHPPAGHPPLGEMNPDLVAEGFTAVYRDFKMLVFFALFMIVAFVMSGYSVSKADFDTIFEPEPFEPDATSTPSPTMDPEEARKYIREGAGILAASIVISSFMAWLSILAVQSQPYCMLYTGMVINLAVFFGGFILTGSFIFLIVGGLLCLWYSWILMDRGGRLKFAIWVVTTSGLVLQKHSSIVILTFFWLLFQAALVFGLTFGALTANQVIGAGGLLFIIFAVYWLEEVMYNIIGVTMSSVTANWALDLQTISNDSPVSSSFKHSTSYALGSIALGSLIVTIIRFMRMIARSMAERRGQNAAELFLACLCLCMLQCLENLARWFNEWAFAYIGIYQIDFTTAASNVWTMFKTNGWEAIMNDAVTGLVTGIPPLIALVIMGVGGGLFANFALNWDTTFAIIMGVISGIVAFFLVALTMGLIDRAQNVIFLCYLHDDCRVRFARNQRDTIVELENRLRDRHPDITNWPEKIELVNQSRV